MFNFSKKTDSDPIETPIAIETADNEKIEDEWIWVEGYKATDFYMRGYDNFQFELGKIFELPEGEEPKLCSKGFHFCTNRRYIRQFYPYGRLWKVKALVRKSEYIVHKNPEDICWNESNPYLPNLMKLVAKAIEFIEEIPVSEARTQDFYKVNFCKTDEDYLDFIKWVADKKHPDAWILIKYLDMMREADISDLLAQIWWNGFKYKSSGEVLANYALGLHNSGVSADMMIYLMTQKVSELALEDSK